MKGLVVYRGIHGSTEQYALWISEELGFEMKCSDNVSAQELMDANVVVMGSSVYRGRLSLSGWMAKHREILSAKRMYLFTVSGTHPTEKIIMERILDLGTPEILKGKFCHYPLHGSLRRKDLSIAEKLWVRFGLKMEDNQDKSRKNKDFNFVSKDNIRAIVDDVLKSVEA